MHAKSTKSQHSFNRKQKRFSLIDLSQLKINSLMVLKSRDKIFFNFCQIRT
jgi:hypothetical protein